MLINTLALIAIRGSEKNTGSWLDWSLSDGLGFVGNALFSMRFLVQWLRPSDRAKVSSSLVLVLEHRGKRDDVRLFCLPARSVGILAYLPNSLFYIRI